MNLSTQTVQDQLGRKVTVPQNPQRIISLVPSQTELLFDLGLNREIAGVTKFCIHPQQKVQGKPIVGGTKNFRFDLIESLQPDLIVANKEENDQAGLERLAQKYPVWISDIETLPQAQDMIAWLGKITGRETSAQALNQEITEEFLKMPHSQNPAKVAYFIWRNPYMVAGKNTFINEMLTLCGFQNPCAFLEQGRYPEVTPAVLQSMKLHRLFLSSEPFPFQEKHLSEMQALCPDTQISLVDGTMFSWYGSRLAQAPAYLRQLLEKLE